jgi:hypothetical protein
MSDNMYDELALERAMNANFGVDLDIMQHIVTNAPVGRTAKATLFLTKKKQLYLYVDGQAKLTLGDVKKIISRMGLKAELFFPPKGQKHYFEENAKQKFAEVFPGRKHVNDEDLIFYRTLVSYNPALVLISEIKDGHVYQFDEDAVSGWRVGAKFAYRRIVTS